MWILVFFDLPTLTRDQRYSANRFRQLLMRSGFWRVQYSVYARWCVTDKTTESVMRKITRGMTDDGFVRILKLTDDRWARSVCLVGKNKLNPEQKPSQLILFPPAEVVKQAGNQQV